MDFLRRFGLPVIALVVVVAWALFAVLMLTGTLVAAQQIDNRVNAINTVYPQVGENLQALPLADETGRIADEISRVAQPVGPQFTAVVASVGTIEASVKSIEGSAANINTSVKSINTSVKTIGGTVDEIDSTLSSVNDKVGTINASAQGINDSFDGILGRVRSIDDGVAGINNRAGTVIDLAGGIKDNLGKVRDPVLPDIVQNSAAIAGSPIINPLDLSANPLLAGLQVPPLLDPATAPLVLGPAEELPAAAAGPLDAGVLPEAPALLGPDAGAGSNQEPPRNEQGDERDDGLLAPLGGLTGR